MHQHLGGTIRACGLDRAPDHELVFQLTSTTTRPRPWWMARWPCPAHAAVQAGHMQQQKSDRGEPAVHCWTKYLVMCCQVWYS